MAVRTLDDHLRASAARTPDTIAIVAGRGAWRKVPQAQPT